MSVVIKVHGQLQFPWTPHRPFQHPVCLLVVDKELRLPVPGELTAQTSCDVSDEGSCGGSVARLYCSDRVAPAAHTLEEVHVVIVGFANFDVKVKTRSVDVIAQQVAFFGLVDGHENELGYFSLNELKSVKVRGLGIERDMYFSPKTIKEIRELTKQYKEQNPEVKTAEELLNEMNEGRE